MTPDEQDLIRRYIAEELDTQGRDIAELLVLIDPVAAAMLDASLDERDQSSATLTVHYCCSNTL